jgi:hypothetical protein
VACCYTLALQHVIFNRLECGVDDITITNLPTNAPSWVTTAAVIWISEVRDHSHEDVRKRVDSDGVRSALLRRGLDLVKMLRATRAAARANLRKIKAALKRNAKLALSVSARSGDTS